MTSDESSLGVKGRASTVFREDSELAIRQKRETETEKGDRAEDHSLSLSDLSVSSRPASALRADPELPFLEMAWSPSQMQEFFNQRLLPTMHPDWEATAVAINDVAYEPGVKCEISYSLQFGDPPRGQRQRVLVTFAEANWLQQIYTRHYGGAPAARPTSRSVVFLPESGCLVEFFPLDWQLPSLARVVEPEAMASLLSQDGSEAERLCWLPKVEVLAYRLHGRCVLRYIMEAPDGGAPTEVIGKVHKPGKIVQVVQTQSILQPQAAAYGLIIPKPLRMVEEWGFFLMERVPGTVMGPLVKQARAPEQLKKEAMGLAAAALASLHRLRCENQNVQSLQTLLKRLRKRAARLPLVIPLLAQQVEALLQQIAQLGARSTATACTFLHGGFAPDQLLMDKGQVGVVDFDATGLGDPAIDVGHFMAGLHNKAVRRASNTFRQLATYFLSEYQARLPEHRVTDRVHLFLSAYLVRGALNLFERHPHKYGRADANSLPVLLLQEAAACLARR